jgi:uncharacterized integral membrane protein
MFKFIVGLIIGILVIIFMVQNVEVVDIALYAWTVSIPRAIMILIVFVIGIALGWVIRSIGYRKKKREMKKEEEERSEKDRD